MAKRFHNANLFSGESTYEDAVIVVEDGTVVEILDEVSSAPDGDEHIDLGGRLLVPGFVDIQVNGGGGVLFNNSPTADAIRRISEAHSRFGTTSLLPTLISDDFDVMRAAIEAVQDAMELGIPGVFGIHFEGPFLNTKRSGAHDETKFCQIDDEAVEILTSLGEDAVTLVTLAPELTDSQRIRQLVSAGVIVFAGHTDASFEECQAAQTAGLTGYTHLFNAMTPFDARAPGVVGAALDSAESVFSIIADGHHTHPASFRTACRAKQTGGVILVTDAMPTVGSDDPWFELNGERIELADGILRNEAGSLAGSNLTMIDAVRNTVEFAGIDWCEAVRMASANPAKAVSAHNSVGFIQAGAQANFVELSRDFNILRVWYRGEVSYVAG